MFARLLPLILAITFICGSAHALFPPGGLKRAEETWRKDLMLALETKKVSSDFANTSVIEAVTVLGTLGGVNTVIDPAALPDKKIAVANPKMKDVLLGAAFKQVLSPAGLEYEVRDGVVFIFNKAKLNRDMLLPEDLPIAKMLDNRQERLSYEMVDTPAGDALKQLTEGPGISMAMDESLKKKPVTMKFTDIGLGHAIRWVVRMSGGKVIVDRDGMKVVKR
jgi:hypothetical protein